MGFRVVVVAVVVVATAVYIEIVYIILKCIEVFQVKWKLLGLNQILDRVAD